MEHRGRLAIGGCSRRHVSHSPGGPAIGCAIGDGSRCHVSRFPVGRPDPGRRRERPAKQGTTCKAVRRRNGKDGGLRSARPTVSPPYAETERICRRAARPLAAARSDQFCPCDRLYPRIGPSSTGIPPCRRDCSAARAARWLSTEASMVVTLSPTSLPSR